MPELLDHRGNPVDMSALREERAGPSLTGVRSIWSTAHLGNLNPQRVAAILRESEVPGDGSSERYVELAEIMEERDLHYLGVLQTRRRQVAQLGVRIEPASDSAADVKDAELARTFFEREAMEDELFDLLDAISKGYGAAEIIWDMSERQWLPKRLEWRLPRWFDFDRDTGARLMRRNDDGGWTELEPYKFVAHLSKAKSGLPIRGGLARAAAWGWLFKNYTIKDWARFVEAYGQPMRVGKFHRGASAEDKQVLYKAVTNVAADAAAIIPEEMMIEFVDDTTVRGRSEIYRDLVGYIDTQISIAVLGQTLTTQEGDSGSYALGQVHNLVRRDIERSDARQLAATLRRDLVIPMVTLNHGTRRAYPKVVIEREEPTDGKLLAETLEKLVPLGLQVSAAEVRAKLGLQEPAADDEVLGAAAPPDHRDQPDTTRLALARPIDNDGQTMDALLTATREQTGAAVDTWLDRLHVQLNSMPTLEALRDWLDDHGVAELATGDAAETLGGTLTAALLSGRHDVQFAAEAMAPTGDSLALAAAGARRPLTEQITFFRRKLNLPTRAWTDIWQSRHDVAFVVAGAVRDELLSDLRGAVDSAIAEGTTPETFRQNFDGIVAKHGWSYKGGRDWRTRVIYETNLRTSYAAGRWQQMQAVKERRPYWRYRHSPASVEPRENHLSWDGLVLHADDPWWHTHYPPNGRGCKCSVDTLSERDLERLGKSKPDRAPGLNRREVTVGHGVGAPVVNVPEGIDPGFAYAPGRLSAAGEAVRRRLTQSLPQPPMIAAAGVSETLARPTVLQALSNIWRQWRRRKSGHMTEVLEVGALSPTVIDALRIRRNVNVSSATVTVTRRELEHLLRASKQRRGTALDEADLDRLPEIIAQPQAVLYDTQPKGKDVSHMLLYVFAPADDARKGKVAVEVDYSQRVSAGSRKFKTVTTNSVRTAGYVDTGDLHNPRYQTLEGEVEE